MPNELHIAAQDKSGLKIVIELLEANPERLNEKDLESGMTPIEFAAQKGSLETVKYLLQKGADIKASANRENLLYWASFNTEDVIDFLTNPENNILEKIEDNTAYFHALILKGDEAQVMQEFDENPKLITHENNKGQTAIFWACLSKSHATRELLLSILSIELSDTLTTYQMLAYNAYLLSQKEHTFDAAIGLLEKTIENLKGLPSTKEVEIAQMELHFLITLLCIENKNTILEQKYNTLFIGLSTEITKKLREKAESIKNNLTSDHKEELQQIPKDIAAINEILGRLALARQTILRGIQSVPQTYNLYEALAKQLNALNNPIYAALYKDVTANKLRSMAKEHVQKYKRIYSQFVSEGIGFILDADTLPEEIAIPALSRALNMSFCIFKSNTTTPYIIKQKNDHGIIPFAQLHSNKVDKEYVGLQVKQNCPIEISLEKEVDSAVTDFFFEEAHEMEVSYEKEVIPDFSHTFFKADVGTHMSREKECILDDYDEKAYVTDNPNGFDALPDNLNENNVISKKSYRIHRNKDFSLSLQLVTSMDDLPKTTPQNARPSTSTTTTIQNDEPPSDMKPGF